MTFRSRVIAVAGARGSPGCSFVAVGLGRCLARQGLSTLLLDADQDEPGLGAYLDLPAAGPVPVRAGPLLWLAGAEPGEDGRQLVAGLRAAHQAVIADLGHHASRLQRQLAEAADWLLWVVSPDPLGLERADRALAAGHLGAASAGLVFNRIRAGCLGGADSLLSGRHRVPVLARIKEDARAAAPACAFRRPFQQLSRCLHPDAAMVGWAWP